jgi:hypothetical protein
MENASNEYVLSFDEWFAEHVSFWLQRPDTPAKTLFDRFFSGFAQFVQAIFKTTSANPSPASVDQFMRQLFTRTPDTQSEAAAAAESAATDLNAGVSMSDALRARIDEAMRAVEFLPMADAGQALKLATVRATVMRDPQQRTALAAVLATRMNGSFEDRAIALTAISNHILNVKERRALSRAVFNPRRRMRLSRLVNDPRVDTDDTIAFAHAYDQWLQGNFKLSPEADSIFGRIFAWARKVLGIVQSSEQAQAIFTFIRDQRNDWTTLEQKLSNQRLMATPASQMRTTEIQRGFAKLRGVTEAAWDVIGRRYATRGYMGAGYMRNPAVRAIVEEFINPVFARDRGATYHETRLLHSGEFIAQFQSKVMDRLATPNDHEAVLNAWYDNTDLDDPRLQAALTDLRRLYSDMHAYARNGKLELGHVRNYAPWIWDVNALQENKDAFIDALVEYAPEDFWSKRLERDPLSGGSTLVPDFDEPSGPIPLAQKRARAEAIYHAMIAENGETEVAFSIAAAQGVATPHFNAGKRRYLAFLPTDVVKPFLVKDINTISMSYIRQIVSNTEFTKKFGARGARLRAMMDRARAAGADETEIRTLERYVMGSLGILGQDRPAWHKNASQAVITYENYRVLGLSGLASISDFAGIYWRTGSVRSTLKALVDAAKLYRDQGGDLERVSRAVGAAIDDSANDAVNWGYDLKDMPGTVKSLNDALFTVNGTRAITLFTRRAMFAAGHRLLADKAESTDPKDVAERRNLGLKEGDVQLLHDGHIDVLTNDARAHYRTLASKGNVDSKREALTALNIPVPANDAGLQTVRRRAVERLGRDDRVRTALMRIIDQGTLRPSASSRPIEANDTHFLKAVGYHLQSFMWAFFDTFTTRAIHAMRESDAPLSMDQWGKVMRLSMFAILYIVAEMLRDTIQHGDEDDPWKRDWDVGDWTQFGLLNSGVAGPLELADRAWDKEERGMLGLLGLLGPFPQHVTKLYEQGIADNMVEQFPLQNIWKHWVADLE